MDIGKILKTVAMVAGPVVVGKVAGPEVGAAVALGLGSGGGAKALGKIVERKTGARPHKVAGPVAAVGVPALALNLLDPDSAHQLCTLILPGLISLFTHQTSAGLEKAVAKPAVKTDG